LSTIELADFPAFARAATRSRWLRRGAALLALVLALLAALATPRHARPAAELLPAGSNGIVIVDVSASISWETYARIASTLERLRRGGGRAGLVLFSDTAYQALPPRTSVSELRGFERFFVVARPRSGGLQPQAPRSPWTEAFSAGTRISTGLALALQTIREQHLRRPLVLLVSDLDDDAGDLESLTSVALAYRRLDIPIRVVGLNPSPEDVQLVERLLPQGGNVLQSSLPGERRGEPRSRVPGGVIAAAVALSLTLAFFLGLTERLRWSRA
jgi:hypothetical protein